jgi:ribonuclease-3
LAKNFLQQLAAGLRGFRRGPDGEQGASKVFAEKFGVRFKDRALLDIALTHRSILTNGGDMVSNERLEFLGDSVLGLVTTDSLFRSMSDADEGELTKARSRIVNKSVLGKIGLELGLIDILKYARAEIKEDERALLTLSADAIEAVVGAIYLDGGYELAYQFVQQHIVSPAVDESQGHTEADYKSKLQEVCQARFRTHPQYKVVKRMGPEHRKVFHVEVMIQGKTYGFGTGRSKKEAEQQAAGQAIRKLEGTGRQGRGPRGASS